MPKTPASRRPRLLAALIFTGIALCNPAALAQDSTAPALGLPGDALDAYSTSQQSLNYIVDLGTKTSSWNRFYALAPIVKASKSNISGYFDLLVATQVLSNRFSANRPIFSTNPYALWTSPGQGINGSVNTTPSTLPSTGKFGQQLALSALEFGPGPDGFFGTGDDENNVVGSVLNFQFRNPNRLWVSRIYAMQNKSSAAALATASFGIGAADELGALHIYADSYGNTAALKLTNRELERVRLSLRNPALINTIDQSNGASNAASTNRVRITSTSMTVPSIIPESLVTRPVMLATDFASNLVAETTNLNTTVVASPGGSPRGSLSFIPSVYTPTAGVGTAATLVRTDTNTKTRGIQIIGLSAAGAVTGTTQLVLPTTTITDPVDGFSPGAAFTPLSNHEFTNYASQASFRGGSQVAITVLPGGDLAAAALVVSTGGGSTIPQGQDNYIAVARVPAAGGAATWSVAAHTGNAAGATGGTSKAILGMSGPSLVPIGRLAKYTEVYGSAATGPSISSPAMDRAGNIYFMATISLNGAPPTLTTGLLRANRNIVTNGYELELLARLGDIQLGANSARNYQIQFMGIADADSTDSGSIFAGNIVQDTAQGVNLATLPYASPMALGLLAFHAKIVYDTNSDGQFIDPSGPGASGGNDQAYNVVLALMPRIAIGDFNRDGNKTVQDIFDFLAAWFASAVDYNGDGAVTVQDIFDFLGDWFAP